MPDRLVLRVAFDGSGFHGTQRQPDVPTVNGQILQALDEAGSLAEEPRLRAQGRVDAGVSARDHSFAVDVCANLEDVARTVAGEVPGVVPWAGACVHERFDPRLAARSRTYRYRLPARELDLDRLVEVWACFEGTHDFAAFARVDGERDQRSVRRVDRTRAWQVDDVLVLEVTAPTFLRHQVRRMVGAAHLVASGEQSLADVQAALAGGSLQPTENAAATGLMLWRVGLTVDWEPLDRARAIAREQLQAARDRLAQRLATLEAVSRPERSTPGRSRS